eukprot:COSAG06_NODE_54766_length_293_cov_0.536082_1_plen_70_part_10
MYSSRHRANGSKGRVIQSNTEISYGIYALDGSKGASPLTFPGANTPAAARAHTHLETPMEGVGWPGRGCC